MRLLVPAVLLSSVIFAQDADTVRQLAPVTIHAYSMDRSLSEVGAAVGVIRENDIKRFNEANILPAVNSIPGVRMEERSPGSFRFSIRGSLLRSPFGVRNVKVYWNGLPLTDGGGNTYLNLIDPIAIGTIEIIKGPAASLYGANTGGVVLLNPATEGQTSLEFGATIGSFGMQRYITTAEYHKENFSIRAQYSFHRADGYREQSAFRRAASNVNAHWQLGDRSSFDATLLLTRVFYETPGGLTKAQYDDAPTQARPAAGPNRGAVEQNAHVENTSPYIGVMFRHAWSTKWQTKVGVFGSYSDFSNPAIRNYERRYEHNLGSRIENTWNFTRGELENKVSFGGEYQYFFSPLNVFNNDSGARGSVQTVDELESWLAFAFAQGHFELSEDLFLTIGLSVNSLSYDFVREQPAPITSQSKDFGTIVCPRFSMLKKFSDRLSVFCNASNGYSPPSLAEVRPSTNTFNSSLAPENGYTGEIGARGSLSNVEYDLVLYSGGLNNTIVIQRAADGAEYFVNAGKTIQQGVEILFSWNPIKSSNGIISDIKVWNSYNYNYYRFREYVHDGVDYSGKKLTGVAPVANTSGLDVTFQRKIIVNITGNYVDHIPLNDQNSEFAKEYFLLGCRVSYRSTISDNGLEIFGGVDNLLDQEYSLGNDLNAIGGRFYNAAPSINFYAGVKFEIR